MYDVAEWLKMLLKSYGVNTARIWKYVWKFLNVMNERMMLHVLNFVLQADAYLGSYQIYMMELLSS